MKHLLNNFLYGLKLALFMPCNSGNFKISWDMLWGIIIFTLISHMVANYSMSERGDVFNVWGYHFHVFTFSMIMFASYFISKTTKSTRKIMHFPVVFYNGIWIILFFWFLWPVIVTEWISAEINDQIEFILVIWSFLIAFRVIALYHDETEAHKKIFCAGIATAAMYILFAHTYMGSFYYYQGSGSDYETQLTALDKLTAEELFASQTELLERDFSNLLKAKDQTTDIYGISFGSYGDQGVFKREARYVKERLEEKLVMKGRTVVLINSEETVLDVPVANITNLNLVLNHIAGIIQPEEDIVLIYLTSHGDEENGLSVDLDYRYSMLDLNGERFAEILKNSGVKNKVIIISSCYSGAMIPFLEDENTMIITASANNKQSYGCSDEADLTYFADAYFKKALSVTTDLEKAFYIAKKHVEDREKNENLLIASNPQIYIGKNIKTILKKYKSVSLVNSDEAENSQDIEVDE